MAKKGLITLDIVTDMAEAIRDQYGIDDEIAPIEMPDYIRDLKTVEKNYRYRASWRGLVSPINGVYLQGFYDNGIAIDDKIYFARDLKKSHYNSDQLTQGMDFFCYDTTNNTLTSWKPTYNENPIWLSAMWGDEDVIYGFGYPYRYKSTDKGETWTRDSITSPQYDPVPVFKLKSGRIIGTMLARTKFLMISDDNGLTWYTISPFNNYSFVTTMSHGTICELDDCIVLYFNSPQASQPNNSVRYTSVSYDNGDTWSTPKACQGELAMAGWSISPGGFAYLGNRYHFVASVRYKNTKYDENNNHYIIGDLRWFVGDAEDVKNGTMSLRKILSETVVRTGGQLTISSEDTGNAGVTLCNGAIYVNYGNIIYNKGELQNNYCSNQGIEIFKISATEREPDAEPYWDVNYKDRIDQIKTEESTDYNYYFYSPQKTNIKQVSWFGYQNTGYIPNVASFVLPMGEGDFEINAIYAGDYLALGTFARVVVGVELLNGELHGYGLPGGVFDPSSDSNSGTLHGGSPTYITLKRTNGVYTYTVNGVTATDPVYDWTAQKTYLWKNIDVDSYVFSMRTTDEAVQDFIDSNPREWNVNGLSMLTIRCNENYPEREIYSITNNLTQCVNSNNSTTIREGSSYYAEITPNTDYNLSSVSCTMGGVDVVVQDNIIDIPSVSGEIIITAVATLAPVELVSNGLVRNYEFNTYDSANNTWTDSVSGATVSPANGTVSTTETDMVRMAHTSFISVRNFLSLCPDDCTIEFSNRMGSNNTVFTVNSNSSAGSIGYPAVLHTGFYISQSDYIWTGNIYQTRRLHTVITKDSSTGEYKYYVNGEYKGSKTLTDAWANNASLYFAGWGGNFGTIRFYNRALSQAEITQNFRHERVKYDFN